MVFFGNDGHSTLTNMGKVKTVIGNSKGTNQNLVVDATAELNFRLTCEKKGQDEGEEEND